MKKTVLGAAAGLALLAAPAVAAPVAVTKDVGASVAVESAIEKVHGWHSSCQLGARGWHFHDRWRNRIECRPFRRWRRW